MKIIRFVAAPLLSLTALVGCTDGGAPPAQANVRDSAGVTIVENPAAPTVAWQVSDEPTVDIGVLDGEPEYQLFNARGATRLSDGRIVVANAGTYELRFYHPDGSHQLSVGRKGGGPGEFEQMAGPWRLSGDSTLVYDFRESRASVFGPDGAFVRSFRLQTGEGVQFPLPLGVAEGGALIAQAGRVFMGGQEKTGVSRDSTTLLRYDLSGSLQDTIALLPGSESYVKSSENSISVRPLPFGRSLEVALAGDHLVIGSTDSPEMGVRSLDGDIARIIRWTQPEQPVTSADIAAFKEREAANLEEQDMPESLRTMQRELLEEIPYPETFPAFTGVLADELDHVWVRRAGGPSDPRGRWLVFDPEGRLRASVEVPAGLTVREIGADWILGTWRDQLEVEHVRLHGLQRSTPSG